jgi:imidazolonepropionase-like amidohydrolase
MLDSKWHAIRPLLASFLLLAASSPGLARAASGAPVPTAGPATLFQDVRVFDGKREGLSGPSDVLVRGRTIERIAPAGSIPPGAEAGAKVIPGGGRVLMPGLIDAHWHTMLLSLPAEVALFTDLGFLNLQAGANAQATLMRGFTSVRDLGGPAFGLKRAIDAGIVAGPRIYPSGAMISQTGGHGDFRFPFELPRGNTSPLARSEVIGASIIADGVSEVQRRVREQLALGASQVKLTAGGGVSSPGPLGITAFSDAELRAAVEAARNWGTYVTVHAYSTASVQQAIAAGVPVIDHGHLVDDATARLMASKGIWWSLQPFLDDEDAAPQPDPLRKAEHMEVVAGTDRAYALAKKYGVKTAFGTDILFDARLTKRQGAQLVKMLRWYTPAQVLKMATGDNGQLLALSGMRNPYPGKLGVVEAGALADLLLVDGNPVENIKLLEDPERNLLVIMKDGKVYKNVVGSPAR